MGELVSLKGARKTRARAEDKLQAAANRAAFGRTKAQKSADAAAKAKRELALDQARREP